MMMRSFLPILILLIGMVAGFAPAPAAAPANANAPANSNANPASETPGDAITGIRTGGDSDLARLVLETGRAVPFSMFLLSEPYRLVIDMQGVEWRIADKAHSGLLFTPPLKGYRFARHGGGTSRLVIDLDAPAIPVRAFPLAGRKSGEGGQRLVIDFIIGGQTSFNIAAHALRKNGGKPIAPDAPEIAEQSFAVPAPRPASGDGAVADAAAVADAVAESASREDEITAAIAEAGTTTALAPPPGRPERNAANTPQAPPSRPALALAEAEPSAQVPTAQVPPARPGRTAKASSGKKATVRTATTTTVAVRKAPRPIPPAPAAHRRGKWVVFIDPGHGGKDPGAIGVTGVREKDINLKAARELARILEKTGKVTPVLSRNDDRFYRLRTRIALAREARADVFISLHADAASGRKAKGVSIFTLSDSASDKEAAHLARQENKADLVGGPDLGNTDPALQSTLLGMFQRESRNQSARFAARLIAEMEGIPTTQRGHRFAGFAVLKAPDVPSVLIEMGFLTNRADEKRLKSAKYRRDLMGRIARAVVAYLEESNTIITTAGR